MADVNAPKQKAPKIVAQFGECVRLLHKLHHHHQPNDVTRVMQHFRPVNFQHATKRGQLWGRNKNKWLLAQLITPGGLSLWKRLKVEARIVRSGRKGEKGRKKSEKCMENASERGCWGIQSNDPTFFIPYWALYTSLHPSPWNANNAHFFLSCLISDSSSIFPFFWLAELAVASRAAFEVSEEYFLTFLRENHLNENIA